MQILKASYACNAYLLPTYYIKHRRDHADSSCIAFCTGKTEMPFEFEKYIHTRITYQTISEVTLFMKVLHFSLKFFGKFS